MAEHTPGYVAALAAALHQANVDALITAQNGDLLQIGHLPLTPFAVECNVLLPNHKYVDQAHHEHVHLTPLEPPTGYIRGDRDWRGWVFCKADADGAVPITIAVTQTRDEDDPETTT
jgi:hypothetical protein